MSPEFLPVAFLNTPHIRLPASAHGVCPSRPLLWRFLPWHWADKLLKKKSASRSVIARVDRVTADNSISDHAADNYRRTVPRAWILWPPTPSHATCTTCRILCATPRWVAQLKFASSILLFRSIVLRALKIFRYFRRFVRFRVAMILFSNRHK